MLVMIPEPGAEAARGVVSRGQRIAWRIEQAHGRDTKAASVEEISFP